MQCNILSEKKKIYVGVAKQFKLKKEVAILNSIRNTVLHNSNPQTCILFFINKPTLTHLKDNPQLFIVLCECITSAILSKHP